jgi:hypothetical protein
MIDGLEMVLNEGADMTGAPSLVEREHGRTDARQGVGM